MRPMGGMLRAHFEALGRDPEEAYREYREEQARAGRRAALAVTRNGTPDLPPPADAAAREELRRSLLGGLREQMRAEVEAAVTRAVGALGTRLRAEVLDVLRDEIEAVMRSRGAGDGEE